MGLAISMATKDLGMTAAINAAATSEQLKLSQDRELRDDELDVVTGGIGIQREPTKHPAKVSV
jgi:hypothetical protein